MRDEKTIIADIYDDAYKAAVKADDLAQSQLERVEESLEQLRELAAQTREHRAKLEADIRNEGLDPEDLL